MKLLLTAGAAALGVAAWALPRSPLPPPTGPHPVGTATVMVPVVSAAGPRRLPVQVWYPAAEAGSPAPLLSSGAIARGVQATYGIPAPLLAPTRLVRGHASHRARPLPGPRPTVVLVHGWMGMRWIHANLAEDLASNGQVVIAADHVGGALASDLGNGQVTMLDPALLPAEGTPSYWPAAEALVDRFADDVSGILTGVGALLRRDVGLTEVELDALTLIGHSTGGGAAVVVAARDDRVRSVVGLDPWVAPVAERLNEMVLPPMIAIRSTTWVGNDNDRLLESLGGVQLRGVDASDHKDFTVLGFLSPLIPLLGMTKAGPQIVHDVCMAAVADVSARL